MPKNIRAMLSVLVALVAAVTFYVEMQAGALKWVVLALAAFMIYPVWLFPEAKERNDNGG